jgi:chromosomal replication initiation ATPase DnaA
VRKKARLRAAGIDFYELMSMSKFTVAEIVSSRRFAPLVDERERIAKIMRAAGHSFPAIGHVMLRDHTSIMHLVKWRGK